MTQSPSPPPWPSPSSLQAAIREQALALGFDQVGFAPATPPPSADRLDEWLESGMHGAMGYMAREPQRRKDPRIYWPEAQSLVLVAVNYAPASPEPPLGALEGRLARYARGDDYHDGMKARLQALGHFVQRQRPSTRFVAVVDSSAVLERAHAEQAGMGWTGKNSMLLSQAVGSFTLLGCLLLDVVLEPDTPVTDHCGSCRRCIDACPTGAIVTEKVVDARKCISYLTIELRAQVPEPLRKPWDGWVFGCDICQEVCPWVQRAQRRGVRPHDDMLRLQPERATVSLQALLTDDGPGFASRWKKSALKRTKRVGLARNAAILLGQSPDRSGAISLLKRGMRDESPLVRVHSAWALGEQGGVEARTQLELARPHEADESVLTAIAQALEKAG